MTGLRSPGGANLLAMLMLAVNVAGIAVSFLTGDPRAMIAKDAIVSSVIAIAILASVAARRPLMSAGLKPFLIKGAADRTAAWDRLSASSARFRRLELLFSAVWGVALLAECAARLVGAYTLPVSTMVWLGTVFTLGAIGLAMTVSGVAAGPMERMIRAAVAAGHGGSALMRGKGINYDTGFSPGGRLSREDFDPAIVRQEMRVIADELGCTAVRVSGGDPVRLSLAARLAADAGLEVWFAPFPCELTTAELMPLFAECAERAEQLRRDGATVVLVAGCELSLFADGFLPGGTSYERVDRLGRWDQELMAAFGALPGRLNGFLAETAAVMRSRFAGPVSYASGMWEPVELGAVRHRGGGCLPRCRQRPDVPG